MTYSKLFPDAHPFELILANKLLFKMIETRACLYCGDISEFTTYRFGTQPVSVCGPDCMTVMEHMVTNKKQK